MGRTPIHFFVFALSVAVGLGAPGAWKPEPGRWCLFQRVNAAGGAVGVYVVNTRADGPSWFVMSESEGNRPVESPASFMQVTGLSPRPGGRYLAVMSVGEGHPALDIVDVDALLGGGGDPVKVSLNPYPGFICVDGWVGGELQVTADVPLDQPVIPADGVMEKPRAFLVDPETGKVRPRHPRRDR